LAWMPPDAFKGNFSEVSDVFSLAVLMHEVLSVMHEVLSVILPHAGKSTAEITELGRARFKVSVRDA